jgi:hypothetical protein
MTGSQRRAELPQGEALQRDAPERHRSEARLYRKGDGQPAKLSYMGHALMENRHGLVIGGIATLATGTAEREAALELIDCHRRRQRITVGADKAYDVADFVTALRRRAVSAHIAIDCRLSKTGKPRATAIDRRTTRHSGYVVSQRCRKRIEEVFGWIRLRPAWPRSSYEDAAAWTQPSRWHWRPTI